MRIRSAALVVALLWYASCAFAQDITLVKHAKRPRPSQPVQAPQPAKQYVIREGDTLHDVLIKAYGAKIADLPALYSKFRKENPWIQDLNYIQAGTKVAIPSLNSHPAQNLADKSGSDELQVRQVSSDLYVVKQGQHLGQILRKVYGIPNDLIFREYLALVMEKNPEIIDPNHIVAGQRLKLPSMKEVLAAARTANGSTAAASGPAAEVQASTSPVPPAEAQAGASPVHSAPPAPVQAAPARPAPSNKGTVIQPPAEQAHAGDTVPAGVPAAARRPVNNQPDVQEANKAVRPEGEKGASDRVVQTVRGKVIPAFERMGGKQKTQGTYFMPMPGGGSISVNTNEIPVMELDTGRKIIFDTNGKITPEMKAFIEKAFPSFKVVSGNSANLEEIMDRVLNVSGFFSINKDAAPLLVGEEEKLRFIGKWVVYKDFSRRNIFVINILKAEESRTPTIIRNYAGHFGIDLIELGGREPAAGGRADTAKPLNRSYKALLNRLKIDYASDAELELISSGSIRIAYKAPILAGKVILTDTMPDPTMLTLLAKQSYTVVNTRNEPVDAVLMKLGLKPDGPPVKMTVAAGRTELEVPAFRVGNYCILKASIDRGIAAYLASTGMEVLIW